MRATHALTPASTCSSCKLRAMPSARLKCVAAARNRQQSRRAVVVRAASGGTNPRTQRLRQLLQSEDILKGPCCHDALSARLIEQAGFPYAFMSGFCTSAARLGAPDTGLISYYEMMDQGRYIHEATKTIPIIGDGDTGYGNALNVKRTVRGYANAGFAGILIEDQVMPKSCGHVKGKHVVSREEAVARIRAAVDARDEGNDILILARTDARQAESLQEALWRAAAFADAGADILFIDALESREEMMAFTNLPGTASSTPKMANMLEGGGKTPILAPQELQRMGFKLVAYPLSLLGVSIRAMELALERLHENRLPSPAAMGSFLDIQRAVGFPEYYTEASRYAVLPSSPPSSSAPPPPQPEPVSSDPHYSSTTAQAAESSAATSSYGAAAAAAGAGGIPPLDEFDRSSFAGRAPPEVEADAVILVPSTARGSGDDRNRDGGRESRSYRRDRSLRVRISDLKTGTVKLETRIPAGFLQGLGAVVPQTAGMNLEGLIQQALGEDWDLSKPLISFNSTIDNIQVFLE